MLEPTDPRRAPDAPGLYAWYGHLDAGPVDWELDPAAGEDKGRERLLALLNHHSARNNPPPLELRATANLNLGWRGDLDSTAATSVREVMDDMRDDEGSGPSALKRTLGSPVRREALVHALWQATPILSAPLYVGVTESLESRLRDHLDDLRRALDVVRRSPESREILRRRGKTFGARAVGAGYDLESLRVFTLNFDDVLDGQLDAAQARTVAEAAEWLLNRWQRPPLGRR